MTWAGIWKCSFKTEEEKHSEARKKIQQRFDAEVLKVSNNYRMKKREQARQRAIKAARAKAKKK